MLSPEERRDFAGIINFNYGLKDSSKDEAASRVPQPDTPTQPELSTSDRETMQGLMVELRYAEKIGDIDAALQATKLLDGYIKNKASRVLGDN